MTMRRSSRSKGRYSKVRERQSSLRTVFARPWMLMNWSMMPQRTPTNSFSAFWASLTRARLSRPRPKRALRAKARPPSIAADEDMPAPMGMSPPKTQLTPPRRCPALTSWSRTPEEIVGPAKGRAVELAELAAEFLVEVAGDEVAEPVGPGRDGEDDGLVRGPGHDESLVIIGVLADEVDPAGRDDEEGLPREVLAETFGDDGDELVHDHSSRTSLSRDSRAGEAGKTQTPKLIFWRISAACRSAGAMTSRPNFAARSPGSLKRQKGWTQRYR